MLVDYLGLCGLTLMIMSPNHFLPGEGLKTSRLVDRSDPIFLLPDKLKSAGDGVVDFVPQPQNSAHQPRLPRACGMAKERASEKGL